MTEVNQASDWLKWRSTVKSVFYTQSDVTSRIETFFTKVKTSCVCCAPQIFAILTPNLFFTSKNNLARQIATFHTLGCKNISIWLKTRGVMASNVRQMQKTQRNCSFPISTRVVFVIMLLQLNISTNCTASKTLHIQNDKTTHSECYTKGIKEFPQFQQKLLTFPTKYF